MLVLMKKGKFKWETLRETCKNVCDFRVIRRNSNEKDISQKTQNHSCVATPVISS